MEKVPVGAIKRPWDDAIDSLQKPFVPLLIPNEALDQHLSINEALYIIALHWVFQKKWQSKHKIPAKANVAEAVEPLGKLLFQISNLCSYCHRESPSGYASNAEWFRQVGWEMKRGDFAAILSPQEKGDGKTKHCNVIQSEVKDLKNWNNPYSERASPHTFRLIEVALEIADRGNSDISERKNVWHTFISAYSKWSTSLKKNSDWGHMSINENGHLVIQEGQGRGKVRVSA